MNERGGPSALGATINVPLPPGSGQGAYTYAFEKVVIPALYKFQPELILVSSGFDANYMDPLGNQHFYCQYNDNILYMMIFIYNKLFYYVHYVRCYDVE